MTPSALPTPKAIQEVEEHLGISGLADEIRNLARDELGLGNQAALVDVDPDAAGVPPHQVVIKTPLWHELKARKLAQEWAAAGFQVVVEVQL